MASKLDSEESRRTLLRTSTDVLAHCVLQIDCLADQWDIYAKDASDLREFANRMIAHAREYGYLEKTRI